MSEPNVKALCDSLTQAGLEVYRTRAEVREIQIAERVRLHLMDSGVRVTYSDRLLVSFTARAQRSDFPSDPEALMHDRVRNTVGAVAKDRGFIEHEARIVPVTDPVDANRVLDTWYEVTFTKHLDDVGDVIETVRWALTVDKYIGH